MSFSEEGFRDPKVLAGALDLAVATHQRRQTACSCTHTDGTKAYLKNYAVDKADALYVP